MVQTQTFLLLKDPKRTRLPLFQVFFQDFVFFLIYYFLCIFCSQKNFGSIKCFYTWFFAFSAFFETQVRLDYLIILKSSNFVKFVCRRQKVSKTESEAFQTNLWWFGCWYIGKIRVWKNLVLVGIQPRLFSPGGQLFLVNQYTAEKRRISVELKQYADNNDKRRGEKIPELSRSYLSQFNTRENKI